MTDHEALGMKRVMPGVPPTQDGPPAEIPNGQGEALPPGPPIMRFFDFTHLTSPRLQAVVAEFAQLAQYVVDYLPAGPEQSVALRKLLEAKDAAVRAALDGMPARGLRSSGGPQTLGVLRDSRIGEVCCGGGPVAAAGEPTFREGSVGECCRGEQPTAGTEAEEGSSHG